MTLTKRLVLTSAVAALFFVQSGVAQQTQQLTNDDVVKMVKSGLPERIIVSAVQASDTKFDISANALVALQQSGVSQSIMDAMIAASAKKRDTGPARQAITPTVGQLSVILTQDGKQQALPIEKTQLAQTKTKASSLGALSADSALNEVFQAGVQLAAWKAWEHSGYGVGYTGVSAAGNVVSGMMSRRKTTVTYVWALPGPTSSIVTSNSPTFEVTYSGIPGVNAEEYEPAIVKLTATSNNWRLLGASQGKTDVLESSTSDWDVYSSFVEEKIPVQSKKIESGHIQVSPASRLAPGQYGVVIRPKSKSKRFSGTDVAKDQGEGLMLDSAWSFAVK